MKKLVLLSLLASSLSGLAYAEPNCKGQMLGNKDAYYKKGAIIEGLYASYDDDMQWDEKSQNMIMKKFSAPHMPEYYNVHGGSQYNPRDIKILNCHLELDPESNTYSLVLNDNSANAHEILRSTIEGKLEAAGVNHAQASNTAPDMYLEKPHSACGQAVAKVISGNQSAASLVEATCH